MFSGALRWPEGHGTRILIHLALACLSAFFLFSLFPGLNLRFLAPIALTPLLIVLARTPDGWQRFLYGWAVGIAYWFFLCNWIQFVLEHHGGMGALGGWGSFALFCILKGLHLAVFSLLAGPLLATWWAVPGVAALWTGLERTHGNLGFAWLDLGNAGIDMSVPLRVAPFLGVYGVSFIFAMLGAAVACVILRTRRERLLPLALLFGLWFLPPIQQGTPAPDQALVVQPNIDPETDWDSVTRSNLERQLAFLSTALPAPLVIWPELPAPLYFYADPEFRGYATDIAHRQGAFLFETVAFNEKNQPYNSAVLLDHSGRELGRYDQIDLVPFGEFVPPLFAWVNRITKETSDFIAGHDIKVFSSAGHRYGVFICYESAFPDLVRQFANSGADVLVNLSNDGYFGHSIAREQHLLLARMRAVENRRFVIRSTNDGITAVIDPAGRIAKRLPPYRQLGAMVNYGGVKAPTFYARHGDWFAWSCLVLTVLFSIWQMWNSRLRNV
jgi:apolipoprotein N-acyltransferase